MRYAKNPQMEEVYLRHMFYVKTNVITRLRYILKITPSLESKTTWNLKSMK